jgi:hypothetical protein
MKESYEKGDSDSILALSLAEGIARCGRSVDRGIGGPAIELRKTKIRTPILSW